MTSVSYVAALVPWTHVPYQKGNWKWMLAIRRLVSPGLEQGSHPLADDSGQVPGLRHPPPYPNAEQVGKGIHRRDDSGHAQNQWTLSNQHPPRGSGLCVQSQVIPRT